MTTRSECRIGLRPRLVTPFAQALELSLQRSKFADAGGDVTDVRVEQRIHISTILGGRVLKRSRMRTSSMPCPAIGNGG